jgi:hypothetical protein
MENRELQAVLREAVEILPDPLRAVFCLREMLDARIGREVRRLYLFNGPLCDRMVESVFARLLERT